MRRDRHHILFDRVAWTQRPESKVLRRSESLIVTLDRDTHNELHKHCPSIPALGFYALQRVNRDFEPVYNDKLASVDNLMLAIEESAKHPKTHEIERRLAGLAVWALDLQRPFIVESRYE